MSFSIATALSRLGAGRFNLWIGQNGTASAGQQLARYNQIMEEFWLKGTWPGLHEEITLASVSGVITLGAAYLRLDGLSASPAFTPPAAGCWSQIAIKPMQHRWQPGGPGYFTPTVACDVIALDRGDAAGVRVYQLTGVTATLDAWTYTGFARKRYIYATDTATVVAPDCYSALELGVRAFNARDERADDADKLWAEALQALDDSMGQFNEGNDFGVMQMDSIFSTAGDNAI